jgi:D-serine deaminase-like pyridoxal phosphate-dependent protein
MYDYQYYKKIIDGKRLPLAYVDLDLLDKNIELIIKRARKTSIRIASKSIRCCEIMQYIFKSHTQFRGIMSFYGAEAVFLSQNGFDDILIAYPITDEQQIEAIGREIQQGKYICLMVDEHEHLEKIEAIGRRINVKFPVCIDIDVSVDFWKLHFGVWRSPLTDMDKLKVLLERIQKMSFIQLDGLMGYEAQIAGVGDAVQGNGLKNNVIRFLKKRSIPAIAERRAQAIEVIESLGFELRFVNGGGTGSIESTIQESGITEVTVGSGFYNSHLFDYYSNFQMYPAAGFALQITRIPKNGTFTCHGGGYIASGFIEKIKEPIPYLPCGAHLDKNEGAGEVQTPVMYKGEESISIGDPIFFRHSKAGELCERFSELHLIRTGEIIDLVPTYRGQNQCFL